MPDSMFGYRLLFLMLFMASIMTWVFLWLAGYIRHPPLTRAHVGNPGMVAATGLALVMGCAVLDFLRLAEHNTLLLALLSIGLVIPWGAVLINKSHALICRQKLTTHH